MIVGVELGWRVNVGDGVTNVEVESRVFVDVGEFVGVGAVGVGWGVFVDVVVGVFVIVGLEVWVKVGVEVGTGVGACPSMRNRPETFQILPVKI